MSRKKRSIAYPAGQEPDLWLPNPEETGHRFVLGKVEHASSARPPFAAICMNPSRANRTEADLTVNTLICASLDNGYSGWMLFNLYPERATNAADLSAFDPALSAQNCDAIEQLLGRFGVEEVLAAWGGLKHRTLTLAKTDVLHLLDRIGVWLYTFDGLTKSHEPRHPTPRGSALQLKGNKRRLIWAQGRLVEVEGDSGSVKDDRGPADLTGAITAMSSATTGMPLIAALPLHSSRRMTPFSRLANRERRLRCPTPRSPRIRGHS